MSARNETFESLEQEIVALRSLVEKLTQPGATPPDKRWVLRAGPPFYNAGEGGYVFDPGGQIGAPVVGPVILLS